MDRPRRGPPSASDSAAPTTGDLMEHAPSRQRRRRRHKAAVWLRRPASWAPALGVHDGSQQVRVVNASPVIVQQDEGLFQLRGLRAMCCVETPQQPTWTFITIRQDAKHRLDRPGVESPGLRPARPNVRSKYVTSRLLKWSSLSRPPQAMISSCAIRPSPWRSQLPALNSLGSRPWSDMNISTRWQANSMAQVPRVQCVPTTTATYSMEPQSCCQAVSISLGSPSGRVLPLPILRPEGSVPRRSTMGRLLWCECICPG